MENVKTLVYVGIIMALMMLVVGCVKDSRKAYGEMQLSSSCKPCENLDGFVPPSQINDEIRKMVGKYKGRGRTENVAIQEARGVT